MIQVDLIRRRVLRALHEVGIYISCLQEREDVALTRMHGQPGVELRARIADYILGELGHEAPAPTDARFSKSRRAVNQEIGRVAMIEKPKPAPKKRGRPPKATAEAESA